jgi:hypothetical protein
MDLHTYLYHRHSTSVFTLKEREELVLILIMFSGVYHIYLCIVQGARILFMPQTPLCCHSRQLNTLVLVLCLYHICQELIMIVASLSDNS